MKRAALTAFVLLTLGAAASAQPPHSHGDHAAMMGNGAGPIPAEMGQATFAAIREIVDILQADPATDWTKVDIEALRQHLIDMDNVALHASVTTSVMDGAITFDVSGDGPVRESIRRMIAAQASMPHGDPLWTYSAVNTDRGARLTVTPDDKAALVKLQGLGYFGLIAQGQHHQVHHLMIARGQSPH